MRLDRVLPPLAPCLVILVMLSPSSAVAEGAEGERAEAEATFDSLYGDDVAKVTRTRDKKDDVALAARLLETARGQDVQPVLAAVLAEKAITLGAAHPDGYDTAVDAADLMLEVAPERSADAYEHLIDLREQQHRAAKGLDKIGAAETLIETFLMAADARLDGGEAAEALGVMRRASRLARSIRSDRQDEIQARMDRAGEETPGRPRRCRHAQRPGAPLRPRTRRSRAGPEAPERFLRGRSEEVRPGGRQGRGGGTGTGVHGPRRVVPRPGGRGLRCRQGPAPPPGEGVLRAVPRPARGGGPRAQSGRARPQEGGGGPCETRGRHRGPRRRPRALGRPVAARENRR